MDTPARFRILTVCTGNVCRSPVAERLLQAGLDELHPGAFLVSSAGTQALVGQAMQPLSAELVERHGGTPQDFVSRQLTQALVRDADLFLAMSTEHRAKIVQLEPAALRRTFTLREFGRMLEHLVQDRSIAGPVDDVVSRWRKLPAAAAAVRHRSLAENPLDNDVVDPYRRTEDAYRAMEGQLVPALNVVLELAAMHRASPQGRRRAG